MAINGRLERRCSPVDKKKIYLSLNSLKHTLIVSCNAADKPLVGWLVLRIYVTLAIVQPYRDLEAGDNQSLKS